MIRTFVINNFKSHKETSLKFSNLTVLCGKNASGKSSVIQALLLLREAYLNKSQFDYLDLKTDSVAIGTAKDALYQYSLKDEISFKIKTDIQDISFSFKIKDLTKTLVNKLDHIFDIEKLTSEALFGENCQFISAARLGPQSSYPKNDVVVDIHNQISVIEGKAEYFVHFLDRKRNNEVLQELCLETERVERNTDLFSQVSAWEREISPQVNVVIEAAGSLDYELKYEYNTPQGKTDKFKSSNVGFGLTYVMPILVAILSSPRGSILFIENPEAHLHPQGQAKLTELICLAAQAGIQIIVETHSDHIINGILVACKNFEINKKGIDKNNVKLFYLGEKDNEQSSTVEEIEVLEGGKISKQPEGFFDQTQHDLELIMGF
jgi:predicted ATPase